MHSVLPLPFMISLRASKRLFVLRDHEITPESKGTWLGMRN